MPETTAWVGKHGPNRLSSYQGIHRTVIDQFIREGFVTTDSCSFTELGDRTILLAGRIDCVGGILYIDVSKLLEILDGDGPNALVQTVLYSYNAVFAGRGNVFRYDSPHEHFPRHHVHRYAPLEGDGQSEVSVDGVADENWPTLGAVVGELRTWYYENLDRIEAVRQATA